MKRILTGILLISFFAGAVFAQSLTGTLEQVKETGEIKIGYRQAMPPMSFMGKDDTPIGYSVDLCKHIVKQIEKKIGQEIKTVWVPVTAENRFKALSDHKIDILCGATTKTLSRCERVDFTQLTFVTGGSFMTLRGKEVNGDFAGKKIGVTKGTTTETEMRKLFKETGIDAEIVLLASAGTGFQDLEKGKIDVLAADQVVLIGLALTGKDPDNYTILPALFSYEPLALAVRRNDADFRLIADRTISDLCRSNEILDLHDKWVGRFIGQRPSAFEAMVKLNAIPE